MFQASQITAFAEDDYNGDVIVHIADNSTVYHRAECTYLLSDNDITLQEAVDKGLGRCSRCKPPKLGQPAAGDEKPYVKGYSYDDYNLDLSDSTVIPSTNSYSSNTYNSSNTDSSNSDYQTSSNNSDSSDEGFPYGLLGGAGAIAVGYTGFSFISAKRQKIKDEEERKRKEEELRKARDAFISKLNGKRIRDKAGVPSNIYFYNGMPKDNNDSTFGSFTLYKSRSGNCYHERRGCCSASYPIHSFDAVRYLSPCSKCCSKNHRTPNWYYQYKDLVREAERLGFTWQDSIMNTDRTSGVNKETHSKEKSDSHYRSNKQYTNDNKINQTENKQGFVRRPVVINENIGNQYRNIRSQDGKVKLEVDNNNNRINMYFDNESIFDAYQNEITSHNWKRSASRNCWFNYLSETNYKFAVGIIMDYDDFVSSSTKSKAPIKKEARTQVPSYYGYSAGLHIRRKTDGFEGVITSIDKEFMYVLGTGSHEGETIKVSTPFLKDHKNVYFVINSSSKEKRENDKRSTFKNNSELEDELIRYILKVGVTVRRKSDNSIGKITSVNHIKKDKITVKMINGYQSGQIINVSYDDVLNDDGPYEVM